MFTSTAMTASASDLRPVAAHILRRLAKAQSRGRAVRLDELASDIGVRKEDVRTAVSSLHAEGHVDAQRMRLTMTGFAIAASMRECKLREPRARLAKRASDSLSACMGERPSQMNVA